MALGFLREIIGFLREFFWFLNIMGFIREIFGFLREGDSRGVCNPRFPSTPQYSLTLPKLR